MLWPPEVGTEVGSPGGLVIRLTEILTGARSVPLSYRDFLDFQPHFLVLQPVGVGGAVSPLSLELITQGVFRACSTPERVGCLGTVISCLDMSKYLPSLGWSH